MKRKLTIAIAMLLTIANPGWANELASNPTRLSETQISQKLKDLPDWTVERGQLHRTFEFKNFVDAIAFVNRLVEPAETAGHHPDLSISYNRVTVSLTTHDAGGITQQDFDLARTISQIFRQTQEF